MRQLVASTGCCVCNTLVRLHAFICCDMSSAYARHENPNALMQMHENKVYQGPSITLAVILAGTIWHDPSVLASLLSIIHLNQTSQSTECSTFLCQTRRGGIQSIPNLSRLPLMSSVPTNRLHFGGTASSVNYLCQILTGAGGPLMMMAAWQQNGCKGPQYQMMYYNCCLINVSVLANHQTAHIWLVI